MEYPELITPVVGREYLNRNGQRYLCTGRLNHERVTMERVTDHWTLTAVRTRQYEDGTIEWDHSVDGHWPPKEKK